jgi:hypothetical protein
MSAVKSLNEAPMADCKFYPMCDHKDWCVGIICETCPWRDARLERARKELATAQRSVALLGAVTQDKRA